MALAGYCQELPNENFQNPQVVPCPADSSQQVLGFEEWQAYQTVNDIWNGQIDTNICLYIGQNAGDATIDFSEADTSRKVFIRSVMDSNSYVPLAPHSVYHLADLISLPSGMVLDTSANCPNSICSGAITVVEVPDSTGNGKTTREYRGSLTNDWISSRNFKTCFASEKFSDQKLVEHIMCFKVSDYDVVDQLQVNTSGFINWGPSDYPLNDTTIEQVRTSQFEFSLFDSYNYIVSYQDTTYPSPDSLSFLDLHAMPNVSTQETIEFSIYAGLHYELFTQFRGGEILGDTIRHYINIINWGEQCMPDWVELVFDNGDRLTFAGGMIEMGGPTSCFQFGSGGTLAVADNATFRYGAPGRGILALRTGAEVEIGRDAELIIYNKLYLQEYWEETQSQNIEMTLGPGSHLTFAPGACIDNSNSIGQNMKLVVYLDGGTVDLNGLSPTDRDKVIVKRLAQESEMALTVFGSIASDRLEIELLTRSVETAELNIFSSNGAYIKSVSKVLEKGPNRIMLDLSGMANGLYILEAIYGDRKETARFVKGN